MKILGGMDYNFILKKKEQNKNSANSMYPEKAYLFCRLQHRSKEAFRTIEANPKAKCKLTFLIKSSYE